MNRKIGNKSKYKFRKNTILPNAYLERLGYSSSKTTEIYTHVSKKAIGNIKNPVDESFE